VHQPRCSHDVTFVSECGQPLGLQRLPERRLSSIVAVEQVISDDRRADLVDHLQRPALAIIQPVDLEPHPIAVPDHRTG